MLINSNFKWTRNGSRSPKPILIDFDGEFATYKWPDTGEIFKDRVIVDPIIDYSSEKVEKVILKLTWSDKIPRTKQIILLKNLTPSFNSYSNEELLKLTKISDELEIGEFNEDRAEEIIDKGKKCGLTISVARRETIKS